jgi:hypothetical protein
MARFARDRRLVEAVIDGVDAMLYRHVDDGAYGSDDLIQWLSDNRDAELNDLYGLYTDCNDPEGTAEQQVDKFLEGLGQVRAGERSSARQVTRREGSPRDGDPTAAVWEVSPRAFDGLDAARWRLFGKDGLFERISREEGARTPTGRLDENSRGFEDDTSVDEFLELCRQVRQSDRPPDPSQA